MLFLYEEKKNHKTRTARIDGCKKKKSIRHDDAQDEIFPHGRKKGMAGVQGGHFIIYIYMWGKNVPQWSFFSRNHQQKPSPHPPWQSLWQSWQSRQYRQSISENCCSTPRFARQRAKKNTLSFTLLPKIDYLCSLKSMFNP